MGPWDATEKFLRDSPPLPLGPMLVAEHLIGD